MPPKLKPKRRNHEKRKEKSRDAARSRRGKEQEVFGELTTALPLPPAVIHTLDKAAVMRVAIAHLKLRKLLGPEPAVPAAGPARAAAQRLDQQYMKALDGFVLVVAKEGDIVFLSENVSKHLGLSQIDLVGQSLYDFTHPCDHEDVREALDRLGAAPAATAPPGGGEADTELAVRLKCTLTPKGKNINLKSATFKVIQLTGKAVTVTEEAVPGLGEGRLLTCLVLVAEPIAHPANLEGVVDQNTFLSTHSMNMKYNYVDASVSRLLGYSAEELMDKSLYSYVHAVDDAMMTKRFSSLYTKGQTRTGLYRFLARGGGFVFVVTEATVIYNVRTEKAEHVVCVNHVISEVLEKDLILSEVQLPQETPVTAGRPARKLVPPPQPALEVEVDTQPAPGGMILSTEAILSKADLHHAITALQDTASLEADMAFRAPTAGDVLVSLDLDDPVFDSSSVFLELGIDMPGKMTTSLEPMMPSAFFDIKASDEKPNKLPFITSIQRNEHGVVTDDSSDSCCPVSLHETLSPASSSSLGSPPHLMEMTELTESPNATHIQDPADMTMRAPFISMSGEDDLIFLSSSPVHTGGSLDGEDDRGGQDSMDNIDMLGRTESIFNEKPEKDREEQGSGPPYVPYSILRMQASNDQEQFLQRQKRAPAQPRVNVKTETNRLETGPPPTKRRCLDAGAGGGPQRGNGRDPAGATNTVLFNLLMSGEDRVNGYQIPHKTPLHTAIQQGGAVAGLQGTKLRGLLTCPLSEPPVKDAPGRRPDHPPITPPPLAQYTTFNSADLLQVLGFGGGSRK